MAQSSISTCAQGCFDGFTLLTKIIEEVGTNDQAVNDVIRIEDQFARFKMWAGNIGVFAEGHASLDYRLRDSDEARQFMLNFLNTLHEVIHRTIATLSPAPSEDDPGRKDSLVGPSEPVDYVEPDVSASSAISSQFQGTDHDSILQDETASLSLQQPVSGPQPAQKIENAIDRLYRLSLIIRQPSRANQIDKAEQYVMVDDEGNEIEDEFSRYVRHIIDHRFPNAPGKLRDRLAYGLVIRRKRFLYRSSHQRKLSLGPSQRGDDRKPKRSTDENWGDTSTVQTRIIVDERSPDLVKSPTRISSDRPASPTTASGLPSRPLPLHSALDDVQSTLSTVFTTTQSLTPPVEIPRPPKPATGSKEFECPYCCLVLPIKQTKAHHWRRHVLEDLEPYVCVFEDCKDGLAFFRDRSLWTTHLQSHQCRWNCTSSSHSVQSFATANDYVLHLRSKHAGSFTESQLPLLAKRSKIPRSTIFESCPLCAYVPSEDELRVSIDLDTLQKSKIISDRILKHLAAHLEALAIKSLPWQDASDDDTVDRSQTGRPDYLTVQSEEGSRALSQSDTSLHFSEEISNAELEILEAPGTMEKASPVPDSAYEHDWGFIPRAPYFGHDRDETLQPLLQRLFLGQSSPDAITESNLPAYLVPVYRDPKFFGRDFALDMMQQTLCRTRDENGNDNKPLSYPRCYTVYGPGGMGKTQVAAHFVSKHRAEFDAVLWVHAEDAGKIAQDYKEIAIGLGLVDPDSRDALDLEYTKDAVKRWLVNPRKIKTNQNDKTIELASWLLVFDGVEDGQVLNEFWPYNGPGSVLITSRNPHSWSASLELKPFPISEATDCLFYVTGREVTPEEQAAAVSLSKKLGGLPLALSQMGGMAAFHKQSFGKLLEMFEKSEGSSKFLEWKPSGNQQSRSNYEHNVASVWAFDRLDQGLPLVNIMSLLDPDAIPEALFTSPHSKHESALARLIKDDYITMRTGLLARSLISGNKKERKLFVHKLVQDVARSRMRQSEVRENFMACVELISDIWPFQELTWRHGVARWAACEELFPHIQRLKTIYPTLTPSPSAFDDYKFARLLIDSGWYQHERGKSLDAIFSNNMAQSICESLKLRLLEYPELETQSSVSLAQINYSLVEMAHNRGCIALEINEPKDALSYHKMFNDTMVKANKEHNEGDMRLAISWNELGNAYMLNCKWKKGEECFLKSIEEMRKYPKFKPTTISLPLANLGLAYWLQGKNELASQTLLRGLHDREDEFGIDDRESFITGRFLHALGNVESSLEYHRRALMHYRSTLGQRHHRTADVFVKVAEHNINLGNFEMALALLDHSLDAFSVSHTYMPERTRAGWMRYKALKGLGRNKDAENELANCYQIYQKLRSERSESDLPVKDGPHELDDRDIDDLIVFWSK